MIWTTYKKCIIGHQDKIKPNFNIKYYRGLLSDRKHECNSTKWKFVFESKWHYTEYNSFDDAMSRYKHVLDGKPIEDHNQYKTFLKYVK